MTARSRFEVLMIGAGPAGLAAACTISSGGKSCAVVDDNPDAGGQIWRGEKPSPSTLEAKEWFDRVRQANITFLPGTQVVAQVAHNILLADCAGVPHYLQYDQLILATGARERFLPFPGWTLPGVLGAGGLQALVKTGLPIQGKKVVVAGSGPLLLAVASYLRGKGAKVLAILEQAPWSRLLAFGTHLFWTQFKKILQLGHMQTQLWGVPYRPGYWPMRAEGRDHLQSVTITNGKKQWDVTCDYLACGFGLIPNLELPLLLGCAVEDGKVKVDEFQRSTVPNIFCIGELTGIGGLEKSLIEGQIAGHAATGRMEEAQRLHSAHRKALQFATALEQTFALRDDLRALPTPETLLCRCEDVALAKVREYGCTSWREAKLHCRVGMGPCQGRICGGAMDFLFGWSMESVRPPVLPTTLQVLAGREE